MSIALVNGLAQLYLPCWAGEMIKGCVSLKISYIEDESLKVFSFEDPQAAGQHFLQRLLQNGQIFAKRFNFHDPRHAKTETRSSLKVFYHEFDRIWCCKFSNL